MDISRWVDPSVAVTICQTLLHSVWQVAVLASLAAVVAWRCNHRFGASARRDYTIHVTVLVASLLCLPVTYRWAALNAVSIKSLDGPGSTPAQSDQIAPAIDDQSSSHTEAIASPGSRAANGSITATTIDSNRRLLPFFWAQYAPWVLLLYGSGVCWMFLRHWVSVVRIHRLGRNTQSIQHGTIRSTFDSVCDQISISSAPLLRECESIAMPMVIGIVQPMVLVPASALSTLSAAQWKMILAHEIAHIQRLDPWIHLLQRVTESLLFFNPAIWWLSGRISTTREYCCDEIACEVATGKQYHQVAETVRTSYAIALLKAVEKSTQWNQHQQQLSALAAGGSSPSQLRRRVARLLGEQLDERFRLSRQMLVLMLLLSTTIVAGPFALRSRGQFKLRIPTAQDAEERTAVFQFLRNLDGVPQPKYATPKVTHTLITYYELENRQTQNRIASAVAVRRKSKQWKPVVLEFMAKEVLETTGSVTVRGKETVLREIRVDDQYVSPFTTVEVSDDDVRASVDETPANQNADPENNLPPREPRASEPAQFFSEEFPPIKGKLIDSETEAIISGATTVHFKFLIPKSKDRDELVLAHIVWGSMPDEFAFGIPEKVLQHPERDLIHVQYGVAHPEYETLSVLDGIALKQLIDDKPASARDRLRRIRLVKKLSPSKGKCALRIRYDIPGAIAASDLYIHRAGHGDIGKRQYGGMKLSTVKNGGTLSFEDLEPGEYEIARYRQLEIAKVDQSGLHRGHFLERKKITIEADAVGEVVFSRQQAKRLRVRIPSFEALKIHRTVAYVFAKEATGASAAENPSIMQFDAQQVRSSSFTTEPLEPGDYVLAIVGYGEITREQYLSRFGFNNPRWEGRAAFTISDVGTDDTEVVVPLTEKSSD